MPGTREQPHTTGTKPKRRKMRQEPPRYGKRSKCLMPMDKNEKNVHLPFLKQLLLVLNIFFDDFEVSVDF